MHALQLQLTRASIYSDILSEILHVVATVLDARQF